MRILLPPSEAKRAGGRGAPFGRAAAATSSGLAIARAEVIRAVFTLIDTADQDAVAAALALPPATVADSIERTRALLESPTMPAARRYTGVVYDGLAFDSLSPEARKVAGRSLLIFSGLFGVAAGREAIPDYRVPAKATLPGLGIARTFWRHQLREEMDRLLDGGLIVDLRSSDYEGMWRPQRGSETADRVVGVRVLSPTPKGDLGVISYPSKYFKGRLAGALLESAAAGRPVSEASDLVRIWSSIGGKRGTVQDGPNGVTVELETFTSTVVGSPKR